MSTNQIIEQKYIALNKTCIGWKDISILLDISETQAKLLFTKLKKEHSNCEFVRKSEIPFSLVEDKLISCGLNPAKITKAYKLIIEKDTIRK